MFIHQSVLIADDHGPSRHELERALHTAGYLVAAEVQNTDDVLQRFQELQPDLVVMDVTLPGTLDPLVTIERLRRLSSRTMILVTGAPSQNTVLMEALSMGAVDFILKPFQGRSIRNCLQRNLG